MKRFLSMLLVFALVFTMLPTQALAADVDDQSTATEITVLTEETTSGEERICEEGCILESEEAHQENGGECLVWVACSLTAGCEGADGHEGECYGVALYSTASITISNSRIRNVYVVVYDAANDTETVYYVNSNGVIQTFDKSATAEFAAGTYVIYYGPTGVAPNQKKTVYKGTVTLSGSNASVSLSSMNYANLDGDSDTHTYNQDQYRYAMSIYYNNSEFNHIHVRVEGSYAITVAGHEYDATVSSPSMDVYINGTLVGSHSWSDAADYEWTYTPSSGVTIKPTDNIKVVLTVTLTYNNGTETVVMEDVAITYDNTNNLHKYYEAIAICDGVEGLDFIVELEEVQKEIQYYNVSYEWKVYNTDGSYTTLPAGAPNPPASTSGHAEGSDYVYDTEYTAGTSFSDYSTGLLYTFHGWDIYSHSDSFYVNASGTDTVPTGYYVLDDGDTDSTNNPTITITDDTYIYGYWTVEPLPPVDAYLVVDKEIVILDQDGSVLDDPDAQADAELVWFYVDPGFDADNDGVSRVDIDYSAIQAAKADTTVGEFRLPVYQYEKAFVFTEYNYEVPGYSVSTTIAVTGDNASGDSNSGTVVNVTLTPVYNDDPDTAVELGVVKYTNVYTKKIGTPVSVYPFLYLQKTASDTGMRQSGVEFTLYSDAECTTVIGTYTTSAGMLDIDFGAEGLGEGTYYLKETKAADGYLSDNAVYVITVAKTSEVESLVGDEFVTITTYSITSVEESSDNASYNADDFTLFVENDPILGTFTLTKTFSFVDAQGNPVAISEVSGLISDYFTFHVHGPIARDTDGDIVDLGVEREVIVYGKDLVNDTLTFTLDNLAVGEYLVHETFGSVHGFTWESVTYSGGEEVVLNYEGVDYSYQLVEVKAGQTELAVSAQNNYVEHTESDFYVYKTNGDGAHLAGAVFQLFSDPECTIPVESDSFTTIATTGTDGYAYFTGFTVPESETDGVITYYLKEVAAPGGYYKDSTVYKVEITAVTTNGVTSYEPRITSVDTNESVSWDRNQDVLTVVNDPVLGELTVTKAFGNGLIPDAMTGVTIQISGPDGYSKTVELNSSNNWAATLEGLKLGTYAISELDASIPGYTWNVSYSNTTVVLTEENPGQTVPGTEISGAATITNTYVRNEETFEVPTALTVKKVDENGAALVGAVFTLERMSADGTSVIATRSFTTGADGTVQFDLLSGFIQDGVAISGTYILTETEAPDGYYKPDTKWTIHIEENDGVIRVELNEDKNLFENFWDWVIGLVTGSSNSGWSWDGTALTLTVENTPVVGQLVIEKTFVDNVIPNGLNSITAQVTGPNGYDQSFVLNAENSWSVTVTNLPLGEYVVTELDASVPGYDLTTKYIVASVESETGATLTLAETNPGYTAAGTEISASATIENEYTRNEETYEIPTGFSVKKVDENGAALAGATFTLTGPNDYSVSLTTGEDGIVKFDQLTGIVDADGKVSNGVYTLTETEAPAGYNAISTEWTVTVKEDDGEIRVVLNEEKNLFENFWDWIIGSVEPDSNWDGTNLVLTVENTRRTGSLVVEKVVVDPENYYGDASYSFTLDASDDSFDQTFTLKAGETKTIENIPWGTTYTLTEDTTDAAFTSVITDEGNGKIWADETKVVVTNTYAYGYRNNGLNLVKVDEDDNTKAIAGAGFALFTCDELPGVVGCEMFSDVNGELKLAIETEGTYTLVETTTPEGYHPNNNHYLVTAEEKVVVKNAGTADAITEFQMHIRIVGLDGTTDDQIDYIYSIENTAIKPVVVTVEKIWDDGGYYARPESVEAVLYQNGDAYDTVTLNEDNAWTHTWTGLTDEYTWTVDENVVPDGYAKNIVNDGNDWTITNIRIPNPVEITVTKAWQHNGGKDLPESISVTLYENGAVYQTVELSESNGWTYTWNDLTDVSVWSVDETDVPAGYTKEVTVDGYKFVITNTRTINPVEIHVTKVWVASEGVIHPESVEAILYRDGVEYDVVVLNAENDWSHSWTGLTDEYTWSVDEETVPEGYTKNVTSEGYDFTITNTKEFEYINVSVNKVWYGAGVVHPTSVDVTLYRDGVEFKTVTLSAANNWTYTWENLTDEFEWTVDEPSVPSGYNKTVRNDGYRFTVTNTHVDNPKTGDNSDLFGVGAMTVIGVAGFGICAYALIAPRKKKEDEQ